MLLKILKKFMSSCLEKTR